MTVKQKREGKITPLLYTYVPDVQKLICIYTVMYPTGLQSSKRHIKGSAVKKNALLSIVRERRPKKI